MRETGRMRDHMRMAAMAVFLIVAVAISMAQRSTLGAAQTTQSGSHQTIGGTLPTSAGNSPLGTAGGIDNIPSPFPDNGRQKRNDDRQRRLVADTEKLLALTSQLKAEVASTGAAEMSPEMLKQMGEIEKLAKSVKDKMRD